MRQKKLCMMQIGKQGLSENFFKTLNDAFTTHENVRICILKSAGHEKEKIKEMNEQILEKLGKKYTSRIIGFTIVVKKWRKVVR